MKMIVDCARKIIIANQLLTELKFNTNPENLNPCLHDQIFGFPW